MPLMEINFRLQIKSSNEVEEIDSVFLVATTIIDLKCYFSLFNIAYFFYSWLLK